MYDLKNMMCQWEWMVMNGRWTKWEDDRTHDIGRRTTGRKDIERKMQSNENLMNVERKSVDGWTSLDGQRFDGRKFDKRPWINGSLMDVLRRTKIDNVTS